MELSSRWRKDLTWRCFLAAAITIVVVQSAILICKGVGECYELKYGSLIFFEVSVGVILGQKGGLEGLVVALPICKGMEECYELTCLVPVIDAWPDPAWHPPLHICPLQQAYPAHYEQVWAVGILAIIVGYIACLFTSFNTWVCLVSGGGDGDADLCVGADVGFEKQVERAMSQGPRRWLLPVHILHDLGV